MGRPYWPDAPQLRPEAAFHRLNGCTFKGFVVAHGREQAGQALGLHPDVDCLVFTGSTQVGKYFMQYSAQSNLKQVWLECGGKSPNLVFADCQDLDLAAEKAAFGIFFADSNGIDRKSVV